MYEINVYVERWWNSTGLEKQNSSEKICPSATLLMTWTTLWPNYYCFKLWYLGVELGSSTVLACSTLNRACLNSILVAVVHTSDNFGWIFWWQSPLRDSWFVIAISALFVGRFHYVRISSAVGQVMLNCYIRTNNVNIIIVIFRATRPWI